MSLKLTTAKITLKLLGLFEALIPAALLVWNQYIRRQSDDLKMKADIATAKAKVAEKKLEIYEKYKDQNPNDMLIGFIERAKLRQNKDDTKPK